MIQVVIYTDGTMIYRDNLESVYEAELMAEEYFNQGLHTAVFVDGKVYVEFEQ